MPFVPDDVQKPSGRFVPDDEQSGGESPERTVLGTLNDVGVTALKGAVGLPHSFMGLASLATGGQAGKDFEQAGVRFADAQKILDSAYSPAQQAANKRVQDAQGFTGTLGAAIENPSVIATTVGESIPQMLGGASLARGGLAITSKLAPWVAAGLGEGALGAGSAAEQMRQESTDGLLNGKQTAAALASGAGTALIGAGAGKFANSALGKRLGVADVDTMLAAGSTVKSPAGFIRQVLGSGISEGMLEEMPQSAQEQMWQNYGQDKPLLDGVGKASAMGLLSGAAMGGAGGGFNAAMAPKNDDKEAKPVFVYDKETGKAKKVATPNRADPTLDPIDASDLTGEIQNGGAAAVPPAGTGTTGQDGNIANAGVAPRAVAGERPAGTDAQGSGPSDVGQPGQYPAGAPTAAVVADSQTTLETGAKETLAPASTAQPATETVADKLPIEDQGSLPSGQDVNLQNRDRGRAASVLQMSEIARNPDYMRLGPSRTPDSGAPMVFAVADEMTNIPVENLGREDVAVMSDGQRVPFRYAVVDANTVNPSNFADGRKNEEFNSEVPGTLKALNNGRTAGVRGAWEMGTASGYASELEADAANHGVPPEAIVKTRNPMLVRIYSDADNTSGMAAKSQAQGLGMSTSEMARQDAPLMDSSVLGAYTGGDVTSAANRDFVRAFVGKLQGSGQDVAGMMTGTGELSQDGRKRLQAALMQAAYGNGDLVEEMFDSTDTDIKAIGEALKGVAGEWANMRDSARQGAINPATDITDNLMQVIQLIKKARQDRTALADLVAQPDLLTGESPDPLTVGLLGLFYTGKHFTRAVGKDKLAERLQQYVSGALTTSADAGMFGDQVGPSDILATIIQTGEVNAETATQESQEQPNGSRTTRDGGTGGGERGQRPVGTGPGNGSAQISNGPPGRANSEVQPGGQEDGEGSGQAGSGLTSPTQNDIRRIEDERQAAERKAKKKKEADEEAERKAVELAEVKKRMDAAADTFELGGDALANLTGQTSLLDAPAETKEPTKPKDKPADKPKPAADLEAMFDELMAEDEVKVGAPAAPVPAAEPLKAKAKAKPRTFKTLRDSKAKPVAKPLAEAAKSTASGMQQAAQGLSALFGQKPKDDGTVNLNSGLPVEFSKETYEQAKVYFRQALSDFQDAAANIREAMKQLISMVKEMGGNDAATNMKPYIVRFMQEVQNGAINLEKDDAPSTDASVERDSQGGAAGSAVDENLSDDTGGNESGDGQAGRPIGSGQQDATGVSTGGPTVTGESGDQQFPGGKQSTESESGNARADDSERSGLFGDAGIQPEPLSAEQAKSAARTGPEKTQRIAQQRAANRVAVAPGLENIRATLPYLLPQQQEDVLKAETRFAKADGYGMLFTNGTGTGKTFTGLGVLKRMERQGKTNMLVVVPSEKIGNDWIESAKALDMPINWLTDTKDAGKGIVITTYANLGVNDALATRQWDHVLADESHNLMQEKSGEMTNALRTFRAITMHPDSVHHRHSMLNRADLERQAEISATITGNDRIRNADDTMDVMRDALQRENDKLEEERKALAAKLQKALDAIKQQVSSSQGAKRTRATFLSATPFAYEKTIDWANGYLFDYNDGRASEEGAYRGYNEGTNREQFFMQHLGYRMRTGRLSEPSDPKLDRGLLQRQFNGMLKKSGSLSGRMLDVEFDYDRRFVSVESAIGTRIDEALDWLSEHARIKDATGYSQLQSAISGKFDYQSRRYLLEAIKAAEVVPIIKEHLALGRKVVVFHDYNKGGGFNPFDINGGDTKEMRDAIQEFRSKFKDLVDMPFHEMQSPIEAFKELLPQALLINGLEKSKDRLERFNTFQSDETGPQVMLVQAAYNAGWSGHDTTGKHQRVIINLGQPTQPTRSIQQEGRIYRTGQASNAIFRYLNTGTNWERWAFATTIAQRAGAAENLGMGEMARALKDAYISAFEESGDYRPGHEGEGTGGKERDKAANDALTEYDRAKSFYRATQKKTQATKAKEGADYFATPEPLGLKMVEWADIRPGEDALEPSGGHGAIARWMPETANRTVIEPSLNLRSRLAMVMEGDTVSVRDGTFEDLNVVNKYDGIVMNPPFGSGGKTAVDHLAKAATHLRPGGRIVALIPTGPAADKKFEKWFYEKAERPIKPLGKVTIGGEDKSIYKGDTITSRASWAPTGIVVGWRDGSPLVRAVDKEFNGAASLVNSMSILKVEPTGVRTEEFSQTADLNLVASIKLPQVTFERAGTQVATKIVIIEKVGKDAMDTRGTQDRDMSSIDNINELFDRLENIAFPSRTKEREKAPAPAPANSANSAKSAKSAKSAISVGDSVQIKGESYTVTTYTTNAGKELRGVWVPTKAMALEMGPSTFEKRGLGFFVRERDFPAQSRDDKTMMSRGPASPERNALKELSQADEMYALPKSDAKSLQEIVASNDAGATVKTSKVINETLHTITFADGSSAKLWDRPASPFGNATQMYGAEFDEDNQLYNQIIGRPGENPEAVPETDDVWIDISKGMAGENGAKVYNIAATYAHNNGRIFIGDPSGLTDTALRRRTEQMISSALKFGTTEHLAPHPKQVKGSSDKGVPPLKWIYGDHEGNVLRMIDAAMKSAENAFPDVKSAFTFDPATGNFLGGSGRVVARSELADKVKNSGGDRKRAGVLDKAEAGWRTLARYAVFKSLLEMDPGKESGRGSLLDRLSRHVSRLSAKNATERIFYARGGKPGSLTESSVRAITDQLKSKWANAPEIVVVPNMQDPRVPKSAREEDAAQKSQGAAGEPRGFYMGGKVYVVAGQLRSVTDVATVLFHEALGHHGLRGVFGKELGGVLDQIIFARRGDVVAKARGYGLVRSDANGDPIVNVNTATDAQVWAAMDRSHKKSAAEEVLAEMAQTNPQLGFVRRAIAAIRTWLRENVPMLKDMTLTDAEIIRDFIIPARNFVRNGAESSTQGAQLAFNRGDQGDLLSQYDREEALTKQEREAAALKKEAKDAEYKGAPGKKVTADQVDMFNEQGSLFSRGTNEAVTNPNDVVGNQGGRSADDSTPGAKPLSESKFNAQYMQHIARSGSDIASIMRDGFKSGIGPNLMPPYRGGKPNSIMEMKYRPRAGDVVLLVPKSGWKDTPNGRKIVNGWIPSVNEVLRITEDNASIYQEYLKSFNESTAPDSGGALMFSRTTAAKTTAERVDEILAKPAATPTPFDTAAKFITQRTRLEWATKLLYRTAGSLLDRYTPETIKAGVISDYGVPEAVIDQRTTMQGNQRAQLRKAGSLLEKLATLTRAESRVAYEWMNMDGSDPQAYLSKMQGLPEESVMVLMDVQKLVDSLSQEAVRLGQLSSESYARNRFAYLRRSYGKYVGDMAKGDAKARARAIAVLGDQYKGRGMVDKASMKQIQNTNPDWWKRKIQFGKADTSLKGEKFIRFERRAPSGEGNMPLDGVAGTKQKGKLLEINYVPVGQPIPAKYKDWTSFGEWEVRDTKGGDAIMWRDFTADERTQMGEIDEARFAIAKTLHAMIHDVEVGRYLEWLGQNYAKKDGEEIPGNVVPDGEKFPNVFKTDEWVKVPDSKIPGTQVLRYGKLAGQYIPGPIWNDLRQTVQAIDPMFGETYQTILRLWKMSKTALSPAVHTNNVMSNLVMADYHDVTAGHMSKALRIIMAASSDTERKGAAGAVLRGVGGAGISDVDAAKEIVERYKDSGGDIGGWVTNEIRDEQMAPLLAAIQKELDNSQQQSHAAQVGVMHALQHLMHKRFPIVAKGGDMAKTEMVNLIDMYQSEDDVFRLAAWLKAKEEGATDLVAGKTSRKSFLDYRINAPWIQAMRQSALPFVSFTYRAIPMLLDTAANKPHKLMKLMMLAGAVNAMGVMLGGGGDDDERKLLPEEKSGKIWGMVPKLIRMPWNDANKSPVYLDIRRFIPAGDVFDLGAGNSAIPMLPSMVPGGPLFTLLELMPGNTSTFTGKKIVLETDTRLEAAGKIADHLYKSMMPNIVILPGTYAYQGVVDSIKGKSDAFGREMSTPQALASSVGVKLGSYPADVLRRNLVKKAESEKAEISHNISGLKRQYQSKSISYEEFEEKVRTQQDKRRKVMEKLQEKLSN